MKSKLAIELKGLGKSFGRTPVLRDLDLEVPWGEVLTVLGPNGSGKTTLIRVLATLARLDVGTARVAGLDLVRYGQSIRRMVGVVTHDTFLYEHLTAHENLKFFSRMFGLDDVEARIEAVTRRMGMSSRLEQQVSTLSHGMKKRFSIARALLHDPRVLLMDEPETGLDQEALAMLDEVISSKVSPPRTVVMTTHSLERGLALGNSMAILGKGKIMYQESMGSTDTSGAIDAYRRHTGNAL